MKKFIVCLSALFFAITSIETFAQTIPVNGKYGKVSTEEVEMQTYALDTSAVALVLYDKEFKSINLDASGVLRLTTEKQVRIKVLKEEGTSYGDFKVVYYDGSINAETVTGVEATTYNMVDGKVVASKMSKKLIFDEPMTDDYYKKTWTAPEVKVGSVIECKWTITDDAYWHVDEIYFQRTIPVNLVEVTVKLPDLFTFHKKMTGYCQMEHKEVHDNFNVDLGYTTFCYKVDTYVGRDLPAFKSEPYVYNSRQYMSSVQYDIRSLMIPGVTFKDFTVSWADVDKNYLNSELMSRFNASCHFKDQLNALKPTWEGKSDADIIASVVRMVKENVVWNNEYVIMPDQLAKVVKTRSGSNVDINCLIAACLRQLDYVVEPVFIKERSSGILLDFQPEINPFDTFILRVAAKDGSLYYLDGGSSRGYLNVLPDDFLVNNARIIREGGKSQWVNLTSLCRNSIRYTVRATITPDLRLSCSANAKYYNEESFSRKVEYNSYDTEDELINDMERNMDIEIDEYTASGMRDYSPAAEENFTFTKDLDASGDMLYVNLYIPTFHSKDAFQSLTRTYPIDFPYSYKVTYAISIAIPDGYAVEEMPSSSAVSMPHVGGVLKVVYSANGNNVICSFSFDQSSMLGNASDYADIRSYWQHLNEVYNSMLVLKKVK